MPFLNVLMKVPYQSSFSDKAQSIFRTLSNIYDGTFRDKFLKKSSTTDVLRDPEYASEILDFRKAVMLGNSSSTTTLQMKSIPLTLQYLQTS